MSRQWQTRSRHWRGLSLQLFLLVLLPLTLLLLLVAVGGSLLHQRAMRDLVAERDQRAARAAAAAIDEQLQQRAKAVRGLAQRVARLELRMEEPGTVLEDVVPLLPDFSQGVALFGADGALLAATDAPQTWQSLAPALLGRTAVEPGGVTFFVSPEAAVQWEPHTLVVLAMEDGFTAAGAFSGQELARSALSRVFVGSDGASAFVVSAGGDVIFHTGEAPAIAAPLQHPGVVSALRGESGTTFFPGEEGEHLVAFSPIPATGWALVVEEPWQHVADPLLHTTEWAPLVLVPVLLIALLGLAFGARQIVQPLQSLEEKATALAWGDFAPIEEPVGGVAEIQRLQSELIRMARKVRDAQQSLRGYLGAVTAGQEEERRRLARELHDDTIQSLIALNQRIQLAQMAASQPVLEKPVAQNAAAERKAMDELQEMQQMVSQLIADLRRQIHALRPIYLEDLGLAPALQMLAQEVQNGQDLKVNYKSEGPERRLAPQVELALYRIAQEALSNVARHAMASKAEVALSFTHSGVALTVRDDGRGFQMPESPGELAPQGHFGLLGIHERAELIGARLRLGSQPGEGTTVEVEVGG